MAINFNLLNPVGGSMFDAAQRGAAFGQQMREDKERQENKNKGNLIFEKLQGKMQDPQFQLTATTDFAELERIAPDAAKAAKNRFEAMSKNKKELYVKEMVKARDAVAMGDIDAAKNILTNRIERVTKEGGQPDDSIRAFDILSKDPSYFVQGVDNMMAAQGASVGGSKEKQLALDVSPVKVDPLDGQMFRVITDRATGRTYRENVEGAVGLSNKQKAEAKARERQINLAIERGNEAFGKLAKMDSSISNLTKAVQTIEDGATYGQIENKLPAFKASTIELRRLASELGLDVVANTTFGALSEGELKLAMKTAVPPLDEDDLKDWFTRKLDAQIALRDELYRMATVLGGGETTIPQYLEQTQAIREAKEKETQAAETQKASSENESIDDILGQYN